MLECSCKGQTGEQEYPDPHLPRQLNDTEIPQEAPNVSVSIEVSMYNGACRTPRFVLGAGRCCNLQLGTRVRTRVSSFYEKYIHVQIFNQHVCI